MVTVPRLLDDLHMLEHVLREETPDIFLVLFKTIAELFYGFAHASRIGLKSMFQVKINTN